MEIEGTELIEAKVSRSEETTGRGCGLEKPNESCGFIIIGASGDLTARKVIPALYKLYKNKNLPPNFFILGCARTDLDDEGFREKMTNELEDTDFFNKDEWRSFISRLYYRSIQYNDSSSFLELRNSLNDLDNRHGTGGNMVFYLAIPPSLYESTTIMLGESGLANESNGKRWRRLVVEKPFGRDIESARKLDTTIHEYFHEHQLFRIDHYLAKETVQNILMFRFSNSIFEPVWNRRYIDYVSITAAESLGVEHRAGYYEQAGVLRDMFQNHMMQLLALTAMEPPSLFAADRVRDEKVKVYRSLRPFPVDRLYEFLVLGQYGEGEIEGRKVAAYRDEPGVNPDSLVPTFAMMKVYLDNWRWQGVPFYVTSGKRLAEKQTQVTVQFKEIPHSMFRQTIGEHISGNRLILGIFPEEKITLTFQTKNPGASVRLRSVTMDFHYSQNYSGPALESYEKVLLDCMLGDQMLFWRQDGVELCWSFLTPILRECETCSDRRESLHIYRAGTNGPDETRRIMQGQEGI